jgi:restriction system protein
VDRAFLEDGLIAIGWPQIQDLSELPPSREGFKKRYREIYPDARDGAIPVQAGQLFRFVHEMEQGHLVIYPSKVDKQIHIGRVTGDYRYRLR